MSKKKTAESSEPSRYDHWVATEIDAAFKFSFILSPGNMLGHESLKVALGYYFDEYACDISGIEKLRDTPPSMNMPRWHLSKQDIDLFVFDTWRDWIDNLISGGYKERDLRGTIDAMVKGVVNRDHASLDARRKDKKGAPFLNTIKEMVIEGRHPQTDVLKWYVPQVVESYKYFLYGGGATIDPEFGNKIKTLHEQTSDKSGKRFGFLR